MYSYYSWLVWLWVSSKFSKNINKDCIYEQYKFYSGKLIIFTSYLISINLIQPKYFHKSFRWILPTISRSIMNIHILLDSRTRLGEQMKSFEGCFLNLNKIFWFIRNVHVLQEEQRTGRNVPDVRSWWNLLSNIQNFFSNHLSSNWEKLLYKRSGLNPTLRGLWNQCRLGGGV